MLELNILEKVMTKVRAVPGYQTVESFGKYAYVAIALRIFGAAFEAVTAISPECRKELSAWEEGRRFALGVEPRGPYVTLEKKEHKIRMIGTGLKDPHVSILFKNLDSAMMVYTTYMGVVQASAENRAFIRGDNGKAMEVLRILDIIMTYLLPGIVLKKNFRRQPKLNYSQYIIMLRIYAALTPAIVKTFI